MKKVLGTLIVLTVCAVCLCTAASAEGDAVYVKNYEELNAACANEHAAIVLTADIETGETLIITDGKSISLDLNGHEYKYIHEDKSFSAVVVRPGAELVISNSQETGGITAELYNDFCASLLFNRGKLTLSGVKCEADTLLPVPMIYNYSQAVLEISDCDISYTFGLLKEADGISTRGEIGVYIGGENVQPRSNGADTRDLGIIYNKAGLCEISSSQLSINGGDAIKNVIGTVAGIFTTGDDLTGDRGFVSVRGSEISVSARKPFGERYFGTQYGAHVDNSQLVMEDVTVKIDANDTRDNLLNYSYCFYSLNTPAPIMNDVRVECPPNFTDGDGIIDWADEKYLNEWGIHVYTLSDGTRLLVGSVAAQ